MISKTDKTISVIYMLGIVAIGLRAGVKKKYGSEGAGSHDYDLVGLMCVMYWQFRETCNLNYEKDCAVW